MNSTRFSTVSSFSDNWIQSLFQYQRSWLTFWLYILWDIRHRNNDQLLPGVCNTMHGLLCCVVPFSKRFQVHLYIRDCNFLIAPCGSALSSAFLAIELKACFNTWDLGSTFVAYFVHEIINTGIMISQLALQPCMQLKDEGHTSPLRNLTPRLFTWVNEPEKTRTDALGQG